MYICPGLEAGGGLGTKARVLGDPGSRGPPCLSARLPLAPQGLACASAKLRLAERRQQRLREVQAKHEHLCGELAETQGRLMVEPGRWLEQCESPHPPPLRGAPRFPIRGRHRLAGPWTLPSALGAPKPATAL